MIPIGWWSWTAYYAAINEGETLANADWLSQHLNSLGYNFFQIDEGISMLAESSPPPTRLSSRTACGLWLIIF